MSGCRGAYCIFPGHKYNLPAVDNDKIDKPEEAAYEDKISAETSERLGRTACVGIFCVERAHMRICWP